MPRGYGHSAANLMDGWGLTTDRNGLIIKQSVDIELSPGNTVRFVEITAPKRPDSDIAVGKNGNTDASFSPK